MRRPPGPGPPPSGAAGGKRPPSPPMRDSLAGRLPHRRLGGCPPTHAARPCLPRPPAPCLRRAAAGVILAYLSELTRILSAIEQGDPSASEQLLPLVYDELRRLAAQKIAREKPGQTLQATALVHEAYLRLVDVAQPQQWEGRRHFFAAAAAAMQRILVENARRKKQRKRGGGLKRVDLDHAALADSAAPEALLALDDALGRLASEDPQAAQLVQLRYFTGLSVEEAAEMIGLARSTAYEHWAYARARLRLELQGRDSKPGP